MFYNYANNTSLTLVLLILHNNTSLKVIINTSNNTSLKVKWIGLDGSGSTRSGVQYPVYPVKCIECFCRPGLHVFHWDAPVALHPCHVLRC